MNTKLEDMEQTSKMEKHTEIKNIPWVKDLLDHLQKKVTDTVLSFSQLALNLSTNQTDIDSWVKVLQDQFQESCDYILSDMTHLQTQQLNKIEESLKTITELCKKLQIKLPKIGKEKLSLYEEHCKLKKLILDYQQIIDVRESEFKKLLNQQEILCNSLGRERKFSKCDVLPSVAELKQFQEYLEELDNENFQRLEKYSEIRAEILEIVKTLKYKPTSEWERDICDKNDTKEFCVSDENMKNLERFRDKVRADISKVSDDIKSHWSTIEHLWNLLDVDMIDRELFRKKYSGYSYDVLDALQEELKRCQDLKKTNIKIFIERLRKDLNEIWHKCHCTEKVKSDFGFLTTTCYNEDLLELHENELKVWRKYYEDNKELLMLLEKHQKFWTKMLQLEENATGPNRYNNRGGQLLKEEKERNKLSKTIPAIEDELRQLVMQFQSRTGSEFSTFGQTVEEYISNLHADRENARKLKLSARKLQRDNTVLPSCGKSAISILPQPCSSQQAQSTCKRKLLTPSMENSKMRRVTPRLTVTEPNKKPKIVISRLSTERKRRIEKVKRRSLLKRLQNHTYDKTGSSEYGEFENEISARINMRSTMNSLAKELPPTPQRTPRTGNNYLTVPTTRSASRTPRSHRKSPRTPNRENRQLLTAKSPLKLIF